MSNADIKEYLDKRIQDVEKCYQNLKEYLDKRIQDVEKCYQNLVEPYFDKNINMINTSGMNKKEKEEFINKRNCLLVQKSVYNEILQFIK